MKPFSFSIFLCAWKHFTWLPNEIAHVTVWDRSSASERMFWLSSFLYVRWRSWSLKQALISFRAAHSVRKPWFSWAKFNNWSKSFKQKLFLVFLSVEFEFAISFSIWPLPWPPEGTFGEENGWLKKVYSNFDFLQLLIIFFHAEFKFCRGVNHSL